MGPPGGGGGSRSPVSMPGGRSADIPEMSSESIFTSILLLWQLIGKIASQSWLVKSHERNSKESMCQQE